MYSKMKTNNDFKYICLCAYLFEWDNSDIIEKLKMFPSRQRRIKRKAKFVSWLICITDKSI